MARQGPRAKRGVTPARPGPFHTPVASSAPAARARADQRDLPPVDGERGSILNGELISGRATT
jgi:hypothetical protein